MKADDSKSLPNNNEVSLNTNRLEELWSELRQVWPAVKKNPEIVNKIEHLWNILKNSNNAQIDINQEIQKYLGNSNTTLEASHATSLNNNVADASYSEKTSPASTQDNEDLDSLLSEILFESNVEDAANVSGAEEIDRLIASVLGEDWLKEETSTDPVQEKQTVTDSASNLNIDTDSNIDELVASILKDDVNENTVVPATEEIDYKKPNIADEKITIDKLLNDILTEDNEDESLTSNDNFDDNKDHKQTSYNENIESDEEQRKYQETNATEKEDIDELIKEIMNKDDAQEITTDNINDSTEEQDTTAVLSSDENIDNLINDIISKDDTIIEDTSSELNKPDVQEKTQTTRSTEKEDIDKLINEILVKDVDSENVTDSIYNAADESQNKTTQPGATKGIGVLAQSISNNKTDDNIEKTKLNTPGKITSTSGVSPVQQGTPPTTPEKTKPPENHNIAEIKNKKESSNTSLTVVLLILLLSFITAWMLFFNNEKIMLADKKTDSKIEKESPFIEEVIDRKYQYDTKTKSNTSKVEKSTAYIEPDYIKPDYTTKIETNNNDITITLNTPETPLDTELDVNKNTAIDIIEPLEPIAGENLEKLEPKQPVENLDESKDIIEHAKKVTPSKTKPKRKVFTHKIVKGDTLWAIAKRYVNNPYRYPELARLSKIKNPDRIYPGNTVTIIIYTK